MYPQMLEQDFEKGTVENFDIRASFQILRLQDVAAVGDLQSCSLSEKQLVHSAGFDWHKARIEPSPTHSQPHLVETVSTR